MKKYLKEIESRLKNIKPGSKPSIWKAESYIGGGRSRLAFLDLKVPDVRAEFKKGFSFYSREKKVFDPQELMIFTFIWQNSNQFEALLCCLFYLRTLTFQERNKNRRVILSWLDQVDNWALSDELSAHFSEFLEEDVKLLSTYRKWNRSRNPWQRRQSIVGIMFYSRFRKSKFIEWDQIKTFIDPLMADEDYYVQKGVGWTLREAFNWYPDFVFNYILKNAGQIAPPAWTACTEKLSDRQKSAVKSARKADLKR